MFDSNHLIPPAVHIWLVEPLKPQDDMGIVIVHHAEVAQAE
jgi:hypothetical protein